MVKEDFDAERDKFGRIVGRSGGGDRGGGGRDDRGPRGDMGPQGGMGGLGGPHGGHGGDMGNTYGLSPQFLASLNISGPLHTRVFVANMDYTVDERKLKEVTPSSSPSSSLLHLSLLLLLHLLPRCSGWRAGWWAWSCRGTRRASRGASPWWSTTTRWRPSRFSSLFSSTSLLPHFSSSQFLLPIPPSHFTSPSSRPSPCSTTSSCSTGNSASGSTRWSPTHRGGEATCKYG